MLGTACTIDEQTRMAAAFMECIVSSQRQTLNKHVHKCGYNFTLYLEGSKHLVRKKNKSGLGGNDFRIGGGRIQSGGGGGWEVQCLSQGGRSISPGLGPAWPGGARGLYFMPSAM